ncbi:coenzyme PQQ synthesis protein B [Variibacter gotjawalensis]|uniref:Coenzyme PQQ synthesis protein B n=1 Tax=Variibacter gotjawalensis TaxID=1333996 RepID=A0A0S3PP80_9BRAD|nr:pyrroloquinoline quinone biosynthesis protein PqqB [Variibacter gotjawalensis]NIK48074.1 pyrroloquinoline quinone biosynthesis protein B [Variibacter gotjawalensis]RZS49950.1 pyrroloquinoline quinone biosynthesis protein B [Variibacter gotjawalensis]BAT57777.1 coenzyme PQQ synthesis protein B [Variibacter gotjawalensis]
MARLTAIVLGSAAGGGFPQWNCRCAVCQLAWQGDARVKARTQAGLAISGDGENFVLLNAAPELKSQILATPELQARGNPRGSPIAAAILTGGEIDQITGLLNLRERQPFSLYGTYETLRLLRDNPAFDVLASGVVERKRIALDKRFALPGGLSAELFAVSGKIPLYLESEGANLKAAPGGNVGVEIARNGARLVFVPGAAAIDEALMDRLKRADLVLFDATLYTDDEMITSGTGVKTGRRMGHMPISGPNGSLAALKGLPGRRIYIHINNTNPILIEDSAERRAVEAAGWEVAHDGLKITL